MSYKISYLAEPALPHDSLWDRYFQLEKPFRPKRTMSDLYGLIRWFCDKIDNLSHFSYFLYISKCKQGLPNKDLSDEIRRKIFMRPLH